MQLLADGDVLPSGPDSIKRALSDAEGPAPKRAKKPENAAFDSNGILLNPPVVKMKKCIHDFNGRQWAKEATERPFLSEGFASMYNAASKKHDTAVPLLVSFFRKFEYRQGGFPYRLDDIVEDWKRKEPDGVHNPWTPEHLDHFNFWIKV
jgi:hypothetical protein